MTNNRIITPKKDLYIPGPQYFPNARNPINMSLEYEIDKRSIEFPNTLKWLESIGIKVKNTRFDKYLNTLDFNKKIIISSDYEKEMNSYINALREIDEINWIAESFRGQTITENTKILLNIFVKGAEFRSDDNFNSFGRNTSFHLRMAGYFARAKLFVNVEKPWDVEAIYKDRSIVLEAKRISSLKKVSARIRDAKNQIQKNTALKNNKKAFGIIAIDTYEFMFKSSTVNIFKNFTDCTNEIRNYFEILGNTSWVGKERDKIKKTRARIHLIWINSIIPCFLENENVYITRFQSLFIPIKSRFTHDGQYCQELTDYLALYFKDL